MLETLSRFTLMSGQALEALTQFMFDAARTLEELIGRFFQALLQFLQDAQQWAHDTFNRIQDYLTYFLPALASFAIALAKLSLFYLPTFVCLAVYFVTHTSFIWIGLGLFWFVFITGIGLTYGKRQHETVWRPTTHNAQSANPSILSPGQEINPLDEQETQKSI